MRRIELPAEWSDVAMVITDISDEESLEFLDDDDRKRAAEFRLERRRHEWTAARVAARLLARQRGLIEDPKELRIGARGVSPYAWCEGGGEWSLSLSHSGWAGAAALGESVIGVDLEQLRRIEPGSAKFFLSDDEIRVTRDAATADVMVHLWTAKEAAFKAAPAAQLLRQVRFSSIRFDERSIDARWSDGSVEGNVRTAVIGEGFVLALAEA